MAAQERRQQASEYALLLKQQEQELQAVREELVAVKQTVRTEEEGRVAAERKAEEAQIQLSVERSNHMKLQKVMRAPRRTRADRSDRPTDESFVSRLSLCCAQMLNLERAAHAAAKERLKALAGGFGADWAVEMPESSAPSGSKPIALPSFGAVASFEQAAALDEAQATIGQLRSKLAHSESERERDKHKLQRTVDAAQLKRREWEREKQGLKRQLENHEAEVKMRARTHHSARLLHARIATPHGCRVPYRSASATSGSTRRKTSSRSTRSATPPARPEDKHVARWRWSVSASRWMRIEMLMGTVQMRQQSCDGSAARTALEHRDAGGLERCAKESARAVAARALSEHRGGALDRYSRRALRIPTLRTQAKSSCRPARKT